MVNPRPLDQFAFSPIEQLLKQLDNKKPMTPQQWQERLKPGQTLNIDDLNFPITPEDYKWSGVEGMTPDMPPMTKQDMLNYINENKLQMNFETLSDNYKYGIGRELEREGLVQQVPPLDDEAFSTPRQDILWDNMANEGEGTGDWHDDPIIILTPEEEADARNILGVKNFGELRPDHTQHSTSSYNTPGPYQLNEENLLRYEIQRSPEAKAAQSLMDRDLSLRDAILGEREDTRAAINNLVNMSPEQARDLLAQGKDQRFRAHTFGNRANEMLAWSRTSSGFTPQGESFLLSQENQSDLHQAASGQKMGGYRGETVIDDKYKREIRFKDPETGEIIGQYRVPTDDEAAAVEKYYEAGLLESSNKGMGAAQQRAAIELEQATGLKVHPHLNSDSLSGGPVIYDPKTKQIIDKGKKLGDSAPPKMPFSKNWGTIMSKKELGEAIETGKDYLVWPTGKMQNDRYSPDADRLIGMQKYYDGDKVKHLKKLVKQYGGKESDYVSTFKPFQLNKDTFPVAEVLHPDNFGKHAIDDDYIDDYRIALPEEEEVVRNFYNAQDDYVNSDAPDAGMEEALSRAQEALEAKGFSLEPDMSNPDSNNAIILDNATNEFVDLKEDIATKALNSGSIMSSTREDIENLKQWSPHMDTAYRDAIAAVKAMEAAEAKGDKEAYTRAYETYKGISNGEKITWLQPRSTPVKTMVSGEDFRQLSSFLNGMSMGNLRVLRPQDFTEAIYNASRGITLSPEFETALQNVVGMMRDPRFGGDNAVTEEAGRHFTRLKIHLRDMREVQDIDSIEVFGYDLQNLEDGSDVEDTIAQLIRVVEGNDLFEDLRPGLQQRTRLMRHSQANFNNIGDEIGAEIVDRIQNRTTQPTQPTFTSRLDPATAGQYGEIVNDFRATPDNEAGMRLSRLYNDVAEGTIELPNTIVSLMGGQRIHADDEEQAQMLRTVIDSIDELMNPNANFAPNMNEDLMMALNSSNGEIIGQALRNMDHHANTLLVDVQTLHLGGDMLDMLDPAVLMDMTPQQRLDTISNLAENEMPDHVWANFVQARGDGIIDEPAPGMLDDQLVPATPQGGGLTDVDVTTMREHQADVLDAYNSLEDGSGASTIGILLRDASNGYSNVADDMPWNDELASMFENEHDELEGYVNEISRLGLRGEPIPVDLRVNTQNSLTNIHSMLEEYVNSMTPTPAPTTPINIFGTSVATGDLDEALIPIQNYMGIDDGDFASIFFDDRDWVNASPTDRADMLREYIEAEVIDVGGGVPGIGARADELLATPDFPTTPAGDSTNIRPLERLLDEMDLYQGDQNEVDLRVIMGGIEEMVNQDLLPGSFMDDIASVQEALLNDAMDDVDDMWMDMKNKLTRIVRQQKDLAALDAPQATGAPGTEWTKKVEKYDSPSFHAIKISPEVRNKYNAVKSKAGAGFSQYVLPFAVAPGAWEMYQQMQEQE
jgi:hypothetical protein